MAISEEERKKDEELDRQVLLAEQRREEERLLQEERQREKLEKIKAVEGNVDTKLHAVLFSLVKAIVLNLENLKVRFTAGCMNLVVESENSNLLAKY